MSRTTNPAVLALYRIIRTDVEDIDGSWNGGDVVDALTEWFAGYGISVDEPNPFRDLEENDY
jgi:hypothetical protein